MRSSIYYKIKDFVHLLMKIKLLILCSDIKALAWRGIAKNLRFNERNAKIVKSIDVKSNVKGTWCLGRNVLRNMKISQNSN